jgi:hypothetical protein
MLPAKPPVFVIGCPRSGTTLVSELLEPTTYGSPVETHFITKYAERLERVGPLTDRDNFMRLVGQILRERPVLQWKLDTSPAAVWDRVRESGAVTYRTLVDTLCMMRSAAKGKTSWGDKTPHFILHLETLSALYPDAKYIGVVRDGRDVALSLLEKPWGPNNVYACARYWAQCHRETPALGALRARGALLEVRYETLLQEPEATIDRLYGFLGEACPPDQLQRLCRVLRRSNAGRWRQRMSAHEVRTFESQAGETLRRLGYETREGTKPLSPIVAAAWWLHDRAGHGLHLLKMNTVDAFRIRFLGMQPFAD